MQLLKIIIVRILAFLSLIFLCVQCESPKEQKMDYRIVIIDSCYYIGYNYKFAPLIHKGNCINPYHKKNGN